MSCINWQEPISDYATFIPNIVAIIISLIAGFFSIISTIMVIKSNKNISTKETARSVVLNRYSLVDSRRISAAETIASEIGWIARASEPTTNLFMRLDFNRTFDCVSKRQSLMPDFFKTMFNSKDIEEEMEKRNANIDWTMPFIKQRIWSFISLYRLLIGFNYMKLSCLQNPLIPNAKETLANYKEHNIKNSIKSAFPDSWRKLYDSTYNEKFDASSILIERLESIIKSNLHKIINDNDIYKEIAEQIATQEYYLNNIQTEYTDDFIKNTITGVRCDASKRNNQT